MSTVRYTNTATGEDSYVTDVTPTEAEGTFDQLADESKEEQSKKQPQDWKKKNKRKLPRWAR